MRRKLVKSLVKLTGTERLSCSVDEGCVRLTGEGDDRKTGSFLYKNSLGKDSILRGLENTFLVMYPKELLADINL